VKRGNRTVANDVTFKYPSL